MQVQVQRVSLIDQICNGLREAVARGQWTDWLPADRRLCREISVGRNSLRAALRRLASEGLIEIVPGQGTRIVRGRGRTPRADLATFGMLSPCPLEQLRPRQLLWIDEFREILSEMGRALRFVHGPQYLRRDPSKALRRLIAQERCACWILVRSTKSCQSWFERGDIRCVIAGSCHHGVDLPFVDLDFRAMCRHAATTFSQLGHKRIAFITQRSEAAGDMFSGAGFLEGVRGYGVPDVDAVVIQHDGEKASIAECVRRLMRRELPPTALLVNQSHHYLTVASILAQLGRRIPQDVSLICRDEDRFLSYLEPEPARYVEDPHDFARKLARITVKLVHERPEETPRAYIIPALVRGASLARPERPA